MERPPMDRTGALCAQDTSRTHSSGGLIFKPVTQGLKANRFQTLASRTLINIALSIVGKSFFSKETSLLGPACCARCICHVGCDPPLLTGNEVLTRAILAIGYHDLRLALGVLLVLCNQAHQLFVLWGGPSCCLYRSNHSLAVVNHSMMLVTRSRLATALMG